MVLAYLAGRSGGGGGGDIVDDCEKTPELVSPATVSRDGRSEVECHILRWRRASPHFTDFSSPVEHSLL